MSAQDIILGTRVAHVRELKAEVARLKAENARLRDEASALGAHFDLALLAAMELRALSPAGRMIVVDGWNQILGAGRSAKDRAELLSQWRSHLAAHPDDRVWIVFDGPRFDSHCECGGWLRVSYTGGGGPHRADRFVCDYLRVAKYLGLADRVRVVTDDRDFAREAAHLAFRAG